MFVRMAAMGLVVLVAVVSIVVKIVMDLNFTRLIKLQKVVMEDFAVDPYKGMKSRVSVHAKFLRFLLVHYKNDETSKEFIRNIIVFILLHIYWYYTNLLTLQAIVS